MNVAFPAGRFTAITGPSGSGESTLTHGAAGLDTLTSGTAHIGDTELGDLDDRRLTLLRHDRVGFVFQAYNLVPTLTVEENVRLPLDLAGRRGDPERRDALDALDALVDAVGLRDRLASAVAALPELDTVVGPGRGVAEVDGRGRALAVADPAALARTFDLGTVRGDLRDLGADGIAIALQEADRLRLATGDQVRLVFTDGDRRTFAVRAVHGRSELLGDHLVTRAAWAPHRTRDADTLLAVSFEDGVGPDAGKAAVEQAAARYGDPDVQTRHEYAQSSAAGIDMMLTLGYALLALAVLIALLGTANTLTPAIHERTREPGLLRAAGQTRSPLRAMVRWEPVLVAAFGTTGGLALGAFLGWVLVRASDGASDSAFAVPLARLAVVALAGVTAGALAGRRPARRAARLDVLRAVATQ
ncbi:ATP-binding cassette domain-containing protein [Streptomyces sp. NBC_01275]|uniref:FtsX-like permease family protein n=1 Tax=Streptomyces sp. NBC_01275 TaxID=2903807 RepID=UPI00224DB5B0|nr:FtsX-like permease family protein [Streptomyces sp. NBC_01275]MCX4759805.1 ATP-binding cassette domain-containing protein [Streptomyces sp. NBC_01275]